MSSTSEAVDPQAFVPLLHLTKAKSKQAVNQLFEEVTVCFKIKDISIEINIYGIRFSKAETKR